MRNDVNASNEDSRREIILNVRIKCLLQVTILELVKIEMNDILDVMFSQRLYCRNILRLKALLLVVIEKGTGFDTNKANTATR